MKSSKNTSINRLKDLKRDMFIKKEKLKDKELWMTKEEEIQASEKLIELGMILLDK